jgi:hypothetical protein
MHRGRRRLFEALAVGALVGVGYPIVDVLMACRAPDSEACVWGKAYLPLSLALSVPLLGGSVAGLLYVAQRAWRKRRELNAGVTRD